MKAGPVETAVWFLWQSTEFLLGFVAGILSAYAVSKGVR